MLEAMRRSANKFSVLGMLDNEDIQEEVWTRKMNEVNKYLLLKKKPTEKRKLVGIKI